MSVFGICIRLISVLTFKDSQLIIYFHTNLEQKEKIFRVHISVLQRRIFMKVRLLSSFLAAVELLFVAGEMRKCKKIDVLCVNHKCMVAISISSSKWVPFFWGIIDPIDGLLWCTCFRWAVSKFIRLGIATV